MKTRLFLLSVLAQALFLAHSPCGATQPATPPPSFRFTEATIDELQARMAAGKLSARELSAAYLERIAQVDHAGPTLRSVIEVNPDALAIADQLDAERKVGKVRGPLHGIPVLIKDNIATTDAMETTAGSLALVGAKPFREAFLVARLREAGAVILGKANLSEWANFRSTSGIGGWSGRGGQTSNPYVLDRLPSGSSSGSAVAVSANLCVVAVGTETDGSIVCPSSNCGIVGFKPTLGLVSRTGIIPIAASQDTAGPMTRTVRDAALLLEALSAPDTSDPVTLKRPAGYSTQFASALKPGALRGARLGVLHGPFGFPRTMEPLLGKIVEALRAAGAEIVDLGEVPSLTKLDDPEMEVLLYEFKAGINDWLRSLGDRTTIKSLEGLIAYNEAQRAVEMPLFGQELFLQAQARGGLTDKAYLDARSTCLRLTRTEGIDALLQTHRLDALVALTYTPAKRKNKVPGEQEGEGASSSLAAVAGYPSVTVPAAHIGALPVGLSFIGGAWQDARLLSLAADFEARTQVRQLPRFLTTQETTETRTQQP